MDAQQRRQMIAKRLEESAAPLSAASLARELNVSRQIIVGDVALLRASGADITATPRGYLLGHAGTGLVRTAACSHTPEDMGRELYAIVDAGCEVLDVIVEHPVYGQLAGALHLRTRSDVDQFLRRVEEHRARPLSALTGGIHLHTLRCPDQEACQNALKALETQGFLLNM